MRPVPATPPEPINRLPTCTRRRALELRPRPQVGPRSRMHHDRQADREDDQRRNHVTRRAQEREGGTRKSLAAHLTTARTRCLACCVAAPETPAQTKIDPRFVPTEMAGAETPARIIIDPSFLFTDEALTWLDDPDVGPSLVISESLWQRLENPDRGEQFLPYGVHPNADQIRRIRNAFEASEMRFSYREVEQLPQGARGIRDALLSSNEPLADVLADEWVFLTSQSLAVIAEKTKASLDAFRRAGGQVHVVSRAQMQRGLRAVRRRIPSPLLKVMKRVGRFPWSRGTNFIVAGAGVALLMLPHVGLALTVGESIIAGVAVIAGDP